MAIENLPVVFDNSRVGTITLNKEFEEYLKEGFQFIIGASIETDSICGVRRIVDLFLVPPAVTESEQ